MTFPPDHHFRLWDYQVSHDKMLLRSPVSPSQPYNIDIVFFGVEKLDLPTMFLNGLDISGPIGPAGEHGHLNLFRIAADGQESSVVALAYYIFKNQLDHTESILDRLNGEGFTEEMGEVLYRSTKPRSLSDVAGTSSA